MQGLRIVGYRQLQFATLHPIEQVAAEGRGKPDGEIRVRLLDLAHQGHGDNFRHRWRGTDDHRAAKRSFPPHHRTSNGLHFVHDPGGMRQHFAAGIGDFHATAMSVEQVGAEFFFQQSNLAAERRLCNVQPVGGLAETAQFGHVNQGLELNDIHCQASQSRVRREMRRACCQCKRIGAPWNAADLCRRGPGACRAASVPLPAGAAREL